MENNGIIRIQRGHYRSVNSLDNETANIIRIIGPDKRRQGYWITSDKESLSEYDLKNNYVYLDTHYTESYKENSVDLGDIPMYEENYVKADLNNIDLSNFSVDTTASITSEDHITNINNSKIEDGILIKCKTPNTDNHIKIELDIKINYNIEKLKDSIKLLDLDLSYIARKITDEISSSNFKELTRYSILNMLLPTPDQKNLIEPTNYQEKSKNTEDVDINNAITDIEKTINQLNLL